MEIIESIAWVGLGFVPTLLSLEFVSRRRGSLGAIPVRKFAAKEEVAA